MKLLIVGISLALISWIFSWTRIPVIHEHPFFPLWLGYILTLNGLSEVLFGDSLLKRMRYGFIFLFLISIPAWWFFEFINHFLQNWHYILGRPVSDLEFNIRASIDFSTVIPAVLSTTFLFKEILERAEKRYKTFNINKLFLFFLIFLGIFFFIFMPIYPRETFPLVWIAGFLIIDPINYLLGFPSLIGQVSKGIRINVYSVAVATIFTGFWWEMWNFYSLPKWFYTIPYVGFHKVFEMPILGYLGYPFFGLEILSFTYFVVSASNILARKAKLHFSINFNL
ncbi:MAG: hypothetical protein A3A51_01430 [Candidatus Levybacteria bacterium RIFCSPLOWO2_01_FULL_39_10]|nr:MAG: hypothetical protein A3A51_01430 [Candidatus Levybacteria bacterium RIFCSPLOWO2_01_FULL_39_10]